MGHPEPPRRRLQRREHDPHRIDLYRPAGPPKSAAGIRVVSMPQALVPMLKVHLNAYVGRAADSLVFTGPKGAPLRRSNFQRAAKWTEHVEAVGLPGFHFHDLRHTVQGRDRGIAAALDRQIADERNRTSQPLDHVAEPFASGTKLARDAERRRKP